MHPAAWAWTAIGCTAPSRRCATARSGVARCCWHSTTCTGQIQRRSSCCCTSCAARRSSAVRRRDLSTRAVASQYGGPAWSSSSATPTERCWSWPRSPPRRRARCSRPICHSRVAERIYRDSAGNPFYLKELIRAARRACRRRGWRSWGRRPSGSLDDHAVIASELERLSAARASSSRPRRCWAIPFEPEIAGEVIQMDDATTLAALDELVDRDLVRVDQAPGPSAFATRSCARRLRGDQGRMAPQRARTHGRGSERAGRVGGGARAPHRALGKAWRCRGDRGAHRGGAGRRGPRAGGSSRLVSRCPAAVADRRAATQGAAAACHGRVAGIGG